VEYVVKDGEVIIVDEFTGRLMPGRRWSDGLHQGDRGERERQDRAREPDVGDSHVPELLRMFNKLAGMTGTAETESR